MLKVASVEQQVARERLKAKELDPGWKRIHRRQRVVAQRRLGKALIVEALIEAETPDVEEVDWDAYIADMTSEEERDRRRDFESRGPTEIRASRRGRFDELDWNPCENPYADVGVEIVPLPGFEPRPVTFTLEEVERILMNVGVDITCGACMRAAMTGGSLGSEHTCPESRRNFVIINQDGSTSSHGGVS